MTAESQQTAPEVSIVTPMHNEELCIEEFVTRISKAMDDLGVDWELLIVNDGSTDKTGDILRTLAETDSRVAGLFLARNRGQCTATYAGIQNSRGKFVVIMDGDLQHPPEEVPSLVREIRKGFDLVSGRREKRNESYVLRRFPSLIANWLMRKVSGCAVHDMGGLSITRGELLRSLKLREGQHRFIPAMIYRLGGSVTEVPTSAPPRFAGKSHYGLGRSVDVLFDIVMLAFQNSFKQRPLYLFGRMALLLFLLASGLMGWMFWDKIIHGEHMANRPPFFGAILFYMASVGAMSTGFILEALGDTLETVIKAKPYVIREIVRKDRE